MNSFLAVGMVVGFGARVVIRVRYAASLLEGGMGHSMEGCRFGRLWILIGLPLS